MVTAGTARHGAGKRRKTTICRSLGVAGEGGGTDTPGGGFPSSIT